MQTSSVVYEADGREMVGTLVLPDGSDARPAVLVAHEGGGLNDHTRTIAKRLAELGYVAFALDYYGGGKPLPDREAINERLMGIIGDPERIRALGRAGLSALLASDRVDSGRVAAIGFCFGGTMVLELAARAPPSRPSSASTPDCRPRAPRTPRTSGPRCSCASVPRTR